MNKQQLIEALQNEYGPCQNEWRDGYNSGINIAISLVRQLTEPVAPEGDEREAFEAWAVSVGLDIRRGTSAKEFYGFQRTQEAWFAWQARAALHPVAPEADVYERELFERWATDKKLDINKTDHANPMYCTLQTEIARQGWVAAIKALSLTGKKE